MTSILITGGTGFLGQHLTKKLSETYKEAKISVICRKRRNDSYIDIEKLQNVKVHYGTDIVDYENLEKYFKDIDVVFNLAGLIAFKQSDKEKLISVNQNGTLNVLRACEKHKVKKLIHVSSVAALGISSGVIDENFNFDWSRHKKCVYSYSKHLPNDKVMKSSCNSIIVYPPLIMGPGDTTSTKTFLEAIKNRKMPFNIPGRNAIIDVRDLAESLILLMNKDVKNEKFIVFGGNYSYKEFYSEIANCLDVEPPKRTIPKIFFYPLLSIATILEKIHNNPPVTYENVVVGFQNKAYNMDKITKLGFKPKFTIAQTIKDSWEWLNSVRL